MTKKRSLNATLNKMFTRIQMELVCPALQEKVHDNTKVSAALQRLSNVSPGDALNASRLLVESHSL